MHRNSKIPLGKTYKAVRVGIKPTFSTMSDMAEKFREGQRKLEEKMRQTPPPPPYTGREERQRTR